MNAIGNTVMVEGRREPLLTLERSLDDSRNLMNRDWAEFERIGEYTITFLALVFVVCEELWDIGGVGSRFNSGSKTVVLYIRCEETTQLLPSKSEKF